MCRCRASRERALNRSQRSVSSFHLTNVSVCLSVCVFIKYTFQEKLSNKLQSSRKRSLFFFVSTALLLPSCRFSRCFYFLFKVSGKIIPVISLMQHQTSPNIKYNKEKLFHNFVLRLICLHLECC